jgi:hypothetical protein
MLYHYLIGFPPSLKIKEQYTFQLTYGNHALRAARTDRYGDIELPERVVIPRNYIVEIETANNKDVDKIVFRIPYEYREDLDLCLVVIPQSSFCKTVWFNKSTDVHKTLDVKKYDFPCENKKH